MKLHQMHSLNINALGVLGFIRFQRKLTEVLSSKTIKVERTACAVQTCGFFIYLFRYLLHYNAGVFKERKEAK